MNKEEIDIMWRLEAAERAYQMDKKLIIWDRDGIWILSIVSLFSSVLSLVL